MQYTQLGRTGLKVSQLCLGTMNFGPQTIEPDAFAIMDRALEVGINFFDTANVYGGQRGEGITEQIIGRWLAQGGGRRDKIVLATKVFGGMGEWPNESRLSAYHIRAACDASLRRLQTDHIDLYQMHHIAREAPWAEIWQAMEVLVGQGKVLYVGSSNFAGWHIAQAQGAARMRNFMGLVSEQSLYNLNARMIELEVVPACREFGLGIIPWSPLGGGLLGGVLAGAAAGTARIRAHPAGHREASRANWRRGRHSAPNWARNRPTWRWPGCCTTRSSPRRSSARARSSSSTAACERWKSSCRTTPCSGSTPSSPAPAARLPKPTPGNAAHQR